MLEEKFVEYLEQSIRKNFSLPALSNYKGETLTYGAVGTTILQMHTIFKKIGLKSGDKVALVGKSASNWAVIYLSVISYGAVIVPLLPEFKPEDLEKLVIHSEAALLFCDETIYEKLDPKGISGLKAVLSTNNYANLYAKQAEYENIFTENAIGHPKAQDFSLPAPDNKELAVISYTSGTTGTVKGVMLLHNSLSANVKYARENMPLQSGDRIMSFLPMAHAFSCAFDLLFPITLGCHITILTKTPSPQIVLQAFADVKPSLILSVPLVIEKIYKNKIIPLLQQRKIKLMTTLPFFKNIVYKKINRNLVSAFGGQFKEVVIGGAAFNKDAEAFLKKIKFPFTVGYGMTECGPLISYAPWKEYRLGASGKVIDTLEAKVISDKSSEIVGEIMVRGENVMVGYYKNKELTEEILDADGWMHTGDLGTIDKDNFIHLKGRSKSMILGPSGQNIYPDEIESLLNNLHGISESLVVNRKHKLIALIYPDAEIIKKENLSEDMLHKLLTQHIATINHRVANFMKLSGFEIQKEEFVKTPKKSIKRFLYQEQE